MVKRSTEVIIPIGPSIAYVPLTKGLFALIDSWMVSDIGKHTWYALSGRNTNYAARGVRIAGTTRLVRMHSQILMCSEGFTPDHKSLNGLDNRLANLRPATRSQQSSNRSVFSNNMCGKKGVRKSTRGFGWTARIQKDGKLIQLGYFKSPELAAEAYARAAKELHRDFHRIN